MTEVTSNLRVEQNLVHLGRFLHFSQKVVGVTLKEKMLFTGEGIFLKQKESFHYKREDVFQLSSVTREQTSHKGAFLKGKRTFL